MLHGLPEPTRFDGAWCMRWAKASEAIGAAWVLPRPGQLGGKFESVACRFSHRGRRSVRVVEGGGRGERKDGEQEICLLRDKSLVLARSY